MKIDKFMPFYGADFICAVRAHPSFVKWAYVAAVWYYWAEKCNGLVGTPDQLRRICECSEAEWPEVEKALFGTEGFFHNVAGRWHQKRTAEEYRKGVEVHKRLSAAGKLRWKNNDNA